MDLLKIFLTSKTQEDFLDRIPRDATIPLDQAKVYYDELNDLLQASHPITQSLDSIPPTPAIPQAHSEVFYGFGNKIIAIAFDSEFVKSLIHPPWAHAEVELTKHISHRFQIFKENAVLYLFKDKNYVGHYPISKYHLLQGQFAIELINMLYDKQESDWVATFHASTVCNDKEAIMIVGDSGNGKSTLSAILMAHGMDILADDFTPLSATNTEVYRYPSGISIKKGAFQLMETLFPEFRQIPEHTSYSKSVRIKYIPPINKFESATAHLPCRKIVSVHYDPKAESTLKPVETARILPTLIPESWLSPHEDNAQRFLNWLTEVQCYELYYSDNTFAVSQFKSLFQI